GGSEAVQEVWVRFVQPDAVRELEDISESDWTGTPQHPSSAYEFPQHTADGADVTLIASPEGTLPDEKYWDLPALVELVNSARKSVRVQALTYSHVPRLSEALVQAAARGVQVQLIDAALGWVGTGNWEPDYFERSRNVGLLIDGGQIPAQLEAFFRGNWNSQYAAPFDRAREYTAPRISLRGGQ